MSKLKLLVFAGFILILKPNLLHAQAYQDAYLSSLNYTLVYPCGLPYSTPTSQIQQSLLTVSYYGGGVIDLTCYQTAITITADIFTSVTMPVTLILPKHTVTVNANSTIGNNFYIPCNTGGSIVAGGGFTVTNNSIGGCGGGGGGSVVTFSAGNLTPLFTTSVATPNSTPALSFSLSSAAQNSVFAGPASGGAGTPSFQTAPTIAVTNMTGTGAFSITGNAKTATDLASYPVACSGGQFSEGLSSGSNNCATPSGGGTVTSVSAAALSPLFTSSVGTPTSTPALSFSLSSAAQNSVFAGPATGGAGVPSYQTAPTIAVTNMTGTGGFNITGNSATATNLASYPVACSGGQFSEGLSSGSNNCATPSGGGTVTSVSAAALSPLFTSTVGTPTSTPALSFSLSSAAQNSVFAGPATGGAGAPSYQTAPTIAVTNMTGTGGFKITGNAATDLYQLSRGL